MSELFTLQQVAEHLHVSLDAVRLWARVGYRGILLRTQQAGRRKLVKQEWINQFHADIASRKEVANLAKRTATAPTRKTSAQVTSGAKRHGLKVK